MKRVLVTGANGFVGRMLCQTLVERGFVVRGVVRGLAGVPPPCRADAGKKFHRVAVSNIGPETDWFGALHDIDAVVHLAARVHVMNNTSGNLLAAFREVNTAGTERLARQAAAAGVRRFIYLSSVKVNGEETGLSDERRGLSFSEKDVPNPRDPYAVSKWEAEQLLHNISKETGMEVVIVRPPLVYGPGVKANFLHLLQWVEKGIPLPLGRVNNRRSLIALDNLVDFLVRCLEHPAAAGQTFLVADGEDLSTPELIHRIGSQIGKPVVLLPMPSSLLRMVGRIVGRKKEVDRLCSSLQIDISKAKKILRWKPPVSVNDALRKTVSWYLEQKVYHG